MPVHLRPELPVVEQDYLGFWRSPRYRWWKGLLAILMGTVGFFLVTTVAQLIGWAIDEADMSYLLRGEIPPVGPGFFLANNVALGLCIVVAGLTAWACAQQRPRWLSSVSAGLRWRWLALLVAILLPIWALFFGVQLMMGPLDELMVRDHTVIMIVGILLTTPFQAAGEEYLLRGLLARAVGSWFAQPMVRFVCSTLVTASVFMLLHGAGDPWLNAFYLVFGVGASWVTWRTGGLEAAIALHVVNNLVAMSMLPFVDFSDMFNREAGAGDWTVVFNMGLVLLAVVVVEVLVRRRRLAVTSAPGRDQMAALEARRREFGFQPGQAGPPPA